VTVTDSGNPKLTVEREILVAVEDVNEAPVLPTGQVRDVDENSAEGAAVGSVVDFSDQDDGSWGNVTLELLASSTSPTSVSLFRINSATGQISVSAAGAVAGALD